MKWTKSATTLVAKMTKDNLKKRKRTEEKQKAEKKRGED